MCEQQPPLEKKSVRSKNSSDSNIYLGSHGSHNDDEEISLYEDEDDLDEEDSDEEFDRDVR
jgi:hypothetical protein